jgi:hypothetical protein
MATPKKAKKKGPRKKVKKKKPPEVDLDPVGAAILRSLTKDEEGILHLSEADAGAADKLIEERIGDGPALVEALKAVVALAWYLDQKRGSPKASQRVLEVARTIVPHLEDLGIDPAAELAKDALEKGGHEAQFKAVLGADDRKGPDPRMKEPEKEKAGMLGFLNFKDK